MGASNGSVRRCRYEVVLAMRECGISGYVNLDVAVF